MRTTPHFARRTLRATLVAAMFCLLVLGGCSTSNQLDEAGDILDAAASSDSVAEATADWEEVSIPNVGTMRIPPSMEVQSDEYHAMKEGITGASSDSFIVQQRGLNEGTDEGFDTYARIMVSCDVGSSGDYPADGYDPELYTDDEIAEIDSALEEGLRPQMDALGIPIIDWYPIELGYLGNNSCLHISYSRVGDDGESTQVDLYSIPCDDRIVDVTLSYRLSDAKTWADALTLALQTLEID